MNLLGPSKLGPHTIDVFRTEIRRRSPGSSRLAKARRENRTEFARSAVASTLLMLVDVSILRRLPNVDYSRDGWYFVTMCTHRRRRIMWGLARDIAARELARLSVRFEGASIDCSSILPDHLHVIFRLRECRATLSSIVQCYKSITARAIRAAVRVDVVWQRGFHDRVVRNENELVILREYVQLNASHHRV